MFVALLTVERDGLGKKKEKKPSATESSSFFFFFPWSCTVNGIAQKSDA